MSTANSERIGLDALNALPAEEFQRRLGGVFEHSPWVAEAVTGSRPFPDIDALHSAMMQALLARPQEEQIAFLRAHPQLASRARRPAAIAVESISEQRAAGLDQVEEEKAERLDRLNAAYAERFGFPFIIVARMNSIDTIIAALERRLARTREEEIKEALGQIAVITRLRLDDLIGA